MQGPRLMISLVATFKACQEDSKLSYAGFPGVRASSPVFEVNEQAVADVIAEIWKGEASSVSVGLGALNSEREVEKGNEVPEEAALGLAGDSVEDRGKKPAEDLAEVAVEYFEKVDEAGGIDDDLVVCGEGVSSVGPNGSQYLDVDPVDPWFVAMDEWTVNASADFQSAFMRKNNRHMKGLSAKDKRVVDYFFHRHRAKIDENVFSCRGTFHLHFDLMQSLQDSEFIHVLVIDTWALLLDQFEKHNARADRRGQLKLFFTAQHSLHTCDLLKLQNEVKSMTIFQIDSERLVAIELKKKMVRGSWKYSLERMGSVNGLMSAELIYIPVHSNSHFYLVVVDFRERKIHHLDNLKHTKEENSSYWQLTCLLQDEFSIFLEEMNHPKAAEMKSYDVGSVEFDWNKQSGGFDCGVYVIRHMEFFEGKPYSCADLEKPAGRRYLRALYCARIALAATNDSRFQVYKLVLDFMKKKKK